MKNRGVAAPIFPPPKGGAFVGGRNFVFMVFFAFFMV